MRPTRQQMLIHVALVIAQRSTCTRLHVGAWIARDGRILTTGYNGPPAGMDHCTHTAGRALGDEIGCEVAVHAEANAIAFAARYGMGTDQAELYVTHSPCIACAKLIINAGIVKVVYATEYRSYEGLDLLEKARVETYCNAS